MTARTAVTVLRPREEVERVWRDQQSGLQNIDRVDAAVTFVDAPGYRGTEVHVEVWLRQARNDDHQDGDAEPHPEHARRCVEWGREYERRFIDLLRLGRAAGELSTMDPRLTADAIMSAGPAVGRWYRATGPLRLDQIAGQYVNLCPRVLAKP